MKQEIDIDQSNTKTHFNFKDIYTRAPGHLTASMLNVLNKASSVSEKLSILSREIACHNKTLEEKQFKSEHNRAAAVKSIRALKDLELNMTSEFALGHRVDMDPPLIDIAEVIRMKAEQCKVLVSDPSFSPSEERSRLYIEWQEKVKNIDERYEYRHLGGPMTHKYFPKTKALYMGRGNRFKYDIEEFAKKHGIVLVSPYDGRDVQTNSTVLHYKANPEVSSWTQDFVEFSAEGIHVPSILREDNDYPIRRKYMINAREIRNPDLYHLGGECISVLGAVSLKAAQMGAVQLGCGLEVPVSTMITHSEGGNTLSGVTREGKPYVIVGTDSYYATKFQLIQELGEENVTDDRIRKAFCIDYKVDIENLYFVEQPGDFHLDMCMTVVGPKTVVLNDSVVALNEYKEWVITKSSYKDKEKQEILDELDTHSRPAQLIKSFEDQTAHDLEIKGFNVIRKGGVFRDPKTKNEVMNFFNMVTATTPSGQRVVVALGCIDTYFEDKFKGMLTTAGVNYQDILFLGYEMTLGSLLDKGGISCRVKSIS